MTTKKINKEDIKFFKKIFVSEMAKKLKAYNDKTQKVYVNKGAKE
jgi:hypothetical protein